MGVNLAFFDTFWLMVGTLTIGWNGGFQVQEGYYKVSLMLAGGVGPHMMYQSSKCRNVRTHQIGHVAIALHIRWALVQKGHHTSIRPCMK